MTNLVEDYFEGLAKTAFDAVKAQDPPLPKNPPVFDTDQNARASAWTAIAVHPMSVMETEYVSVVHAAEKRAGNNPEQAKENAFEAMSQFFSLAADAPPLLQPDTDPLIEERQKSLLAFFDLVEDMQAEGVPDVYDALLSLISDAARLIALMTTADELDFAGTGVQDAAGYLGMFDVSADEAADKWAETHEDKGKTADYIKDVAKNLIDPLKKPENAVASARSLYNIEPFYLFRLMHRFLGGDQAVPMDLNSKGIASGAATGAMHRADWEWLARWHQKQIVDLKTRLTTLQSVLKVQFETDQDIIHFFLKGGRAMYTALGDAKKGKNDWDTGILINPNLLPEQWYQAFAAVNDTVVTFLDQARFGYTALLNKHKNVLNIPPPPMASLAVDPTDMRDFTRFGLMAEHGEESLQDAQLRQRNGAALAVHKRNRTVGINGELIDIGISKRGSVELIEHWHDINIVDLPGVGGDDAEKIPVPTLPYFVDDFSTIIREALTNGTADRKLAKRLVRLNLVLNSDDATLARAVAKANQTVRDTLPKATTAFGVGDRNTAAKLKGWVLAGLVNSMPYAWTRPGWIAKLDDYLQTNAAALLSAGPIDALWRQIERSIDVSDRPAVKNLLIAQNAISTVSRRIVADNVIYAQAIGGPELADVPLWKPVKAAIESVISLNAVNPTFGLFYVSGGLAGRMQTAHAKQPSNDLLSMGATDVVEILYRTGSVHPVWAFRNLPTRLNAIPGITADLIENRDHIAVVVRSDTPINGLTISPDKPVVLVIRAEEKGSEIARIMDHVDGWPVASTRDLVRLFTDRAAHSHDFDLRLSRKKSAEFLLSDVLGRQLL
ncbi:hypothetical protein [Parasulfitobacter algicola]|uniref:Uncharacterized protein n=1 Tax=Parasulfitobacter algicola TaxID=2614809 RepID=A0ABX2IL95_9RHOB|nr:hypothetical protein [Sulfitobacter algicola]NSX53641.1 hypothetical protein [Sulfitobacter algicola]